MFCLLFGQIEPHGFAVSHGDRKHAPAAIDGTDADRVERRAPARERAGAASTFRRTTS